MAIVVAAVLGALYSVVLGWVGVQLLYEYVSGTGQIGAEHLTMSGGKGLTLCALLFLAGGVASLVGGIRLITRRQRRLVLVPLVLVLVIGAIGEIVDVATGASASANLIGAGVLVLAALPVALLATRGSRRWLGSGENGPPGKPPDVRRGLDRPGRHERGR
ncbi:MAG TPA: hypothetical protein VHX38_09885 [Pseudonocardiaceae bacterium]|nr:hypothetical protein [Pseudonocardiaceae bacterium]